MLQERTKRERLRKERERLTDSLYDLWRESLSMPVEFPMRE